MGALLLWALLWGTHSTWGNPTGPKAGTHVGQVDLVAGLVKHFNGDFVQAAGLKHPPVPRLDCEPYKTGREQSLTTWATVAGS